MPTGKELYDEIHDSGSALWMHMPVDQGEYLKDIWAVRHALAGFYGLVVSWSNSFHPGTPSAY